MAHRIADFGPNDIIDSPVEYKRNVKVIDGANAFSEAYLGAKGVTHFVNWVNDDNHGSTTKLYAEFISLATKYTVLHADEINTDSTSLVLSVYRDYTPVVGASLTIRSTRVGVPNVDFIPSESSFTLVTSVTGIGDFVAKTPIFSSGSGNTGGGEGGNTNLRILPPNSRFLVELDNRNNATCYSQYQLRWSEIPEDYLPTVGFKQWQSS